MVGSIRKGVSFFVVLALMCTIGTIGFVGFGYATFRSALKAMETAAHPLPIPEISEEQERTIATIDEQVRRLTVDGTAGEVSVPSELFNSWLRLTSYRGLRVIAEHAWFTLNETDMVADLAVPLDSFGAPGRFFNGKVSFAGELRDGSVSFSLSNIQPHAPSTRAFAWFSRFISSRELADALGVEELLSEDVVERCSIFVSSAALHVKCRSRDSAT